MRIQLLSYAVAAHFLFPIMPSAKTLTIPGDANSVQEAVEMAASGDEIILATDYIRWGEQVLISGKDITIRSLFNNKPNQAYGAIIQSTIPEEADELRTLSVQNGKVILRDFILEQPTLYGREKASSLYAEFLYAKIHVESEGFLQIDNCRINASFVVSGNLVLENSYIYGQSAKIVGIYAFGDQSIPAVLLTHSDRVALKANRSTLADSGGHALRIESVEKASFAITNSSVLAGTAVRFRGASREDGGDGIQMVGCKEISIDFTDSQITGGNGSVSTDGVIGPQIIVGDGGNGIFIKDSEIEIHGGQVSGGNGCPAQSDRFLSPGGKGGHGLVAENSVIRFRDTRFQGGLGGPASGTGEVYAEKGMDGLPIFVDEFSAIETVASVQSWELY